MSDHEMPETSAENNPAFNFLDPTSERKTEDDYLALVKKYASIDAPRLAADDMQPSVCYLTDDEEPRLIFFPTLDDDPESRNKVGWAMELLAATIDNLWAIGFTTDTCQAKQMTKHDGTPWGYGEMQHALKEQTVDADLIREAYVYNLVEGDRFVMISVPYTRNGSVDTVDFNWAEAQVMIDEGKDAECSMQGFFPEVMRSSMAAPKLMNEMTKMGFTPEQLNLDMEAARIHTLSVGIKMVGQQTHMACMVPCHSQRESEILKESMEGGPFSENIRMFDQNDVQEINLLDETFEKPAFGEE